MDWSDKTVSLHEVPNQTRSYMRKKLEEKGAKISDTVDEDTDIVLVPMLHQLEKEVHKKYGVDFVSYPDAIADVLDIDFKPCWISKGNLNPLSFSTVIIPKYTQDKTKLEYDELPWEIMEEYALDMGLEINKDVYKGNLLVIMPNTCHYNNIEYIKFFLRQRAHKSNISFITMHLFEQCYREWKRKYPNGHKRLDPSTYELQNKFIGTKWNTVKEATPQPMIDFSNGIPRDYVVIDTEYRNIHMAVNYPLMTEVGAVRVRDGKIVDTYFKIIRNEVFSLGEMKKYRWVDNLETTTVDVVYKELLDFIGDDLIVGHQIYSDLLIMGLNLNTVFDNGSMDTLGLIFHELNFDLGVYNLPAIADMYGFHKNSHHALDDAITTYQLYEMIVDCKVNDIH